MFLSFGLLSVSWETELLQDKRPDRSMMQHLYRERPPSLFQFCCNAFGPQLYFHFLFHSKSRVSVKVLWLNARSGRLSCVTSSITIWREELLIYVVARNLRINPHFPQLPISQPLTPRAASYLPGSCLPARCSYLPGCVVWRRTFS